MLKINYIFSEGFDKTFGEYIKSNDVMNKKQNYLFLILSTIVLNITFGQDGSGIIKYKGSLNQKFVDSILKDMKTRDIPMSHKQFSIDAYNDAGDVELILKFQRNESYYYYNPDLELESGYNTTKGMVGSMPFYTNTTTDKIIEINKYVGNISHKPLKWEVTSETKKIGIYLCFKAIAIEKLWSRQGYFYNDKVVAWFTPEIPLNYGPKHYKGLPGLVLEIKKKKFSIVATQINLNPTKEVKLKIPKIDNVISIEESHKRFKEMIEERKKARKNN